MGQVPCRDVSRLVFVVAASVSARLASHRSEVLTAARGMMSAWPGPYRVRMRRPIIIVCGLGTSAHRI